MSEHLDHGNFQPEVLLIDLANTGEPDSRVWTGQLDRASTRPVTAMELRIDYAGAQLPNMSIYSIKLPGRTVAFDCHQLAPPFLQGSTRGVILTCTLYYE